MSGNYDWARGLIDTHVLTNKVANLVIMMAHAEPSSDNKPGFFYPMRDYIRDVLKNTIPILHLNADMHVWKYEPSFFNQGNWLRITLDGETISPPLRVTVDASLSNVNMAVTYNRGLVRNVFTFAGR